MDGGQGAPLSAVTQALQNPAAFRPPPISELHGSVARRRSGRVVGGVSKRAFDIVAAGGALVVLSPVLLGIWALVRIDSPGPGLFKQRRGGFQGRPFHILKFRTMKTCESRSIAQAKLGDDRTTRLGRFLRRYSIDELPQLFNVLMGDMSVVGPRPHALAHDRQFSAIDRRYAGRHHARPGITGLAQISGSRGRTDTREKIIERTRYDLKYVSEWSWRLDLHIILRTALVVFRDRNVF
jgi:putative colanic acid biosysnthesis UDP-glucose lipid carrier transferase